MNYTYTYRGAGTLWTNLALPNSSRIINGYDTVGRLTQTRLHNSGGTALNTHSYVYNLGHQRTRQTRTDASYVDYTYDHIGQLRTAVGTGGQLQQTSPLQFEQQRARRHILELSSSVAPVPLLGQVEGQVGAPPLRLGAHNLANPIQLDGADPSTLDYQWVHAPLVRAER